MNTVIRITVQTNIHLTLGHIDNMNKKLLAFDIDGTLVNPMTHEIPDSAIQALEILKQQGHVVGIATGRNKTQVQKVIDLKKFDFVIFCNGGYAEVGGTPIITDMFSLEEKNTVIEQLEKFNLEYSITTHEHLYAINPDSEKVQKVIKAFDVYTPSKEKVFTNIDVYQFTVYEDLNTIPLLSLNKEDYIIHSYGWFGYDIDLRNVSKGTALQKLAKYFLIDINDCFAFGDGDNDVHFLKVSGTGIAMNNGSKKAKENADYITTDVGDNGIYNALKVFEFIK